MPLNRDHHGPRSSSSSSWAASWARVGGWRDTLVGGSCPANIQGQCMMKNESCVSLISMEPIEKNEKEALGSLKTSQIARTFSPLAHLRSIGKSHCCITGGP